MPSLRKFFASPRFLAVLMLIAASAAAHGPPSSAPDLAAEWSGSTLMVAGATASGEVILFLIERVYDDYRVINNQYHLVAQDDDGDGIVSFTIDGIEPSRSVAVAFDVESGSYGVAFRGTGPEPTEVPFDSRGRFTRVLGATGLEYAAQRANVFVGRPHDGAWTVFVGDRGPLDADGEVNSQFRIPPQALERIGGAGSGPDVLLPHDLLVVVEPRRMEFSVNRLVESPKALDR